MSRRITGWDWFGWAAASLWYGILTAAGAAMLPIACAATAHVSPDAPISELWYVVGGAECIALSIWLGCRIYDNPVWLHRREEARWAQLIKSIRQRDQREDDL